jgi:hypothetical protein
LIFQVLPALEHHTYSEDDVDEGGIKIKKTNFLHENGNFFRVEVGSPLLDVGGFAKQGIIKYSPSVQRISAIHDVWITSLTP